MKIYAHNSAEKLDINPKTSSAYTKSIMGYETVTLVWEQAFITDIAVGNYVEYAGVKFTLNRLPVIKKVSTTLWQYNAVFQSPQYELTKAAYLLFSPSFGGGQGEFSFTGTPLDFITLLVTNLNRVANSTQWFVGTIVEGEARTLTFSNESCSAVLSRLADEYETEYSVSGNTIHLTAVNRETNLILQYGSTLYDIERVNIDSTDIITRLYPFGSEKNLAADYRAGSKRLLIPSPQAEEVYIEQNTELYGIIEGFKNFDDIYPRLSSGPAGTVTAIGANIKTFVDANLDFNVNSQLIPGTPAKVRFLTGECAGYDLEIASYNHTTKTFIVVPNVDDKDFNIPNDTVFPAIGDQYVLLDIEMPEAYRISAEAELLAAATDYLTKNSHPRVTYRGNFSALYAKVNAPDIRCGDLVTIVDADFGINEQIRIVKLTRAIGDYYSIQYDLSHTVVKSTLQRMSADIQTNERGVIVANQTFKQKYNQAYRNLDELRSKVFDTDGYFDPENIKPLSIETSMLSVGSKSQQLQTDIVFKPNDGSYDRLSWTAGQVIHFGISDTQVKTWNVGASYDDGLVDFPLYIYARCSRTTAQAHIVLGTAPVKFDVVSDYYFFLLGMLHTPLASPLGGMVCGISLTYGQTLINGQYIRTGVISSVDGATYFDLTTGNIKAGANRLNGNGSGSLAGGEITWDEYGRANFGKDTSDKSVSISTSLIPTIAQIAQQEIYAINLNAGAVLSSIKYFLDPNDSPWKPEVSATANFTMKNNGQINLDMFINCYITPFSGNTITIEERYLRLINVDTGATVLNGTEDGYAQYFDVENYPLDAGNYRIEAKLRCRGVVQGGENPKIEAELSISILNYKLLVKKQTIGINGIALFNSEKPDFLLISNTDADYLINARGGFQWLSSDGTKGLRVTNAGVQKYNGSSWVNL